LAYWEYNSLEFYGTCGTPDSDPAGAWCFVDIISCSGAPVVPADVGSSWDYCHMKVRNYLFSSGVVALFVYRFVGGALVMFQCLGCDGQFRQLVGLLPHDGM
jgi:hypothetical protein